MKKEKTCKSPVIAERERERESKFIFKYVIISFLLFPFSASSQNLWDCDEPNPFAQVPKDNTLTSNQINISSFSPGIYYFVVTDENQYRKSFKIIKK